MISLFQIAMIVLLLLGQAFYAGIETGIISVNRLRLEHLIRRHVRGASTIQYFLKNTDLFLGTTLVGTNLSVVAASVLAASLAVYWMGDVGTLVSGPIMTVIVLVWGEYIPKAWFQSNPSRRSARFAFFLRWSYYLFYPIIMLVLFVTRLLFRSESSSEVAAIPVITRDDIKEMTKDVDATDELKASERAMIHDVFNLTHTPCREIMILRDAIVQVSADTEAFKIVQMAKAKNISRFPVYDGEERRFIGFVNVTDILAEDSREGKTAVSYMRPPQFVSEKLPADELLPRMRRSRQPMALVVNEQEKVVGLVTLENVVEKIVGGLTAMRHGNYQKS